MVTEGKEGTINSMIEKHGLYSTIKLIGGYNNSMGDYLSKEDKIVFIKEVVTKLCEEYDDVDVEVGGIIYDETDEEKQIIEFYNPIFITVEKFTKEVNDAEYDYDDFYLGSFELPYEDLTHSVIDKIFHLMLTKI